MDESAFASSLSSFFRAIDFFILEYIDSILRLTSSSSFRYSCLLFVLVRNQEHLIFHWRFTFNRRAWIVKSFFLLYWIRFFSKRLNDWRICLFVNFINLVASRLNRRLWSLKWLLFSKFRCVVRSANSHALLLCWSWSTWDGLWLLLIELVLTDLIFTFADHMTLADILNSTHCLVCIVFNSTCFALAWVYHLNVAAIRCQVHLGLVGYHFACWLLLNWRMWFISIVWRFPILWSFWVSEAFWTVS